MYHVMGVSLKIVDAISVSFYTEGVACKKKGTFIVNITDLIIFVKMY